MRPLEVPQHKRWTIGDRFSQRIQILDLDLYLEGICATHDSGREVTGSAANTDSPPLMRAYGELRERIAIVDHLPPAAHEGKWVASLSNGVAFGSDDTSAKAGARSELIERDVILRSWLGQIDRSVIHSDSSILPPRFSAEYALTITEWLDPVVIGMDITVVSALGIPRSRELPLLLGFGASGDPKSACSKALREGLQRVGFLYGELPGKPDFEAPPSADLHMAVYDSPETWQLLSRWALGSNPTSQLDPSYLSDRRGTIRTQPIGADGVWRARGDGWLPLFFGPDLPYVREWAEEALKIHPIA